MGENPEKHTSGAEARVHSIALVPGMNPRPTARMSFSAAFEARTLQERGPHPSRTRGEPSENEEHTLRNPVCILIGGFWVGFYSVVSGQWSVVSGQWSVVSGQWSVVSG